MGDLIEIPSLLPPQDMQKNESDDVNPYNACEETIVLEDNLLNDELDITVVNTPSFDPEKYDLLKQSFELERL